MNESILEALEKEVWKQHRIIGLRKMQNEVLKWALANKVQLGPDLSESLVIYLAHSFDELSEE
jgi:hypothetical protein